ncbi:MAG: hypothetical protein JO257_30410 [Deltaproteobacteria bacterium]|nr:hypothetical protein [Deltaproteobacteria bacterium]
MRLAPLAVVLLVGAALAGGATSSQKAVEALVRKHLASLAAFADDDKLGLAKDPLVVGLSEMPPGFPGGIAARLHADGPDVTHTVKSVAIGIDDAKGVAWVQAPFHFKDEPRVSPESGEGNLWLITEGDMRFGALVIRDGKDWKLAAVDYSTVVPDQELMKGATEQKPTMVAPTDDAAKAVAGWFKGGLVTHAATGTVIASGTSPSEYAVGAAATKLVAKWDKLGLVVEHAEGRMFGDYAVVQAVVSLPVKGKSVGMGLFAIVRRDGSDWHWLSLQYSH